jgi:oligoribonuclease NrnB/cAMP/cGMP phosphodiesterase (DHH superfamily)
MNENNIIEEYKFYKSLAQFHEKRACDDTCSMAERDFHLEKMKYFDTLLEEKYEQALAIYKDHEKTQKT